MLCIFWYMPNSPLFYVQVHSKLCKNCSFICIGKITKYLIFIYYIISHAKFPIKYTLLSTCLPTALHTGYLPNTCLLFLTTYNMHDHFGINYYLLTEGYPPKPLEFCNQWQLFLPVWTNVIYVWITRLTLRNCVNINNEKAHQCSTFINYSVWLTSFPNSAVPRFRLPWPPSQFLPAAWYPSHKGILEENTFR